MGRGKKKKEKKKSKKELAVRRLAAPAPRSVARAQRCSRAPLLRRSVLTRPRPQAEKAAAEAEAAAKAR